MPSTIIKIDVRELTDAGRWFLDVCRGQSPRLAALLTPRDGVIYAEIGNGNSEDTLRVRMEPDPTRAMRRAHAGDSADSWSWELPPELAAQAQAGTAGAEIINVAGAKLRQHLDARRLRAWIDPDWISQQEAARLVGRPLSTIATAVYQGRLATWEDYRVSNPTHAKRVRRSEVAARWPPSGPPER